MHMKIDVCFRRIDFAHKNDFMHTVSRFCYTHTFFLFYSILHPNPVKKSDKKAVKKVCAERHIFLHSRFARLL